MKQDVPELRPVRLWLYGVVVLIILMVVIGGLTRLTESGLSIVEWKPFAGTLPPMSANAWQEAFDQYKAFPQFQKVNQQMTLSDFKSIYWWEFGHRLLGRLIGIAFALPMLLFFFLRRLKGALLKRLGIALILGGLQGALGWFMVKSGLVDLPRVSHYRLAAHLGLALFLMSYLFWIGLDIEGRRETQSAPQILRILSHVIIVLVATQITFGALTAGLRAGIGYNTFPLMHGHILPPGWNQMMPVWLNFLENPVTVQFIHRSIGWSLLLTISIFWWLTGRMQVPGKARNGIHILFGVTVIQFILGVLTLVFVVPIPLASLHQFGACLVLLSAVFTLHALKRSSGPFGHKGVHANGTI